MFWTTRPWNKPLFFKQHDHETTVFFFPLGVSGAKRFENNGIVSPKRHYLSNATEKIHRAVGVFVCGALHVGIRPQRSILPPLVLAYIHHTHSAASALNSTRTCHSSPAPAANHIWSTSWNRRHHIITRDLFPIIIYLTHMASQKRRWKTLSLRIVVSNVRQFSFTTININTFFIPAGN